MPEPNQPLPSPPPSPVDAPSSPRATGGLFAEPASAARSFPTAAVLVAAVAALLLVLAVVLLGHRHGIAPGGGVAVKGAPEMEQPLAAYAPQLSFSAVEMSESTSFSGGKETFVDGRVTNAGPSTVTGITVQVAFPSDSGTPQLETVPVTLIRSRQPYIDTQPLSAAPLAPGAGVAFRLTFDDIRPDWNQGTPGIRVTGVTTR